MSQASDSTRFWVNVVSFEHVRNGVKAGITQSCHGKSSPLKRMAEGDWIVHYSPKETFQGNKPCQKFTSIGQVADSEVYQFDMGGGFIPWRRNINYLDCEPIPIAGLLEDLTFTQGKERSWGMVFRYGFFEMKRQDFTILYKDMVGIFFDPAAVPHFLPSERTIASKTLV